MFIVSVTFTVPWPEVEPHAAAHGNFLDEHFQEEIFVVSGPKVPHDGGIIASEKLTRPQLTELIEKDPFRIHGVANYDIAEFKPPETQKRFEGSITILSPVIFSRLWVEGSFA